ncbi:50S ribosomal protein L29 [Verrucomicrobiota bacterium]
MKVKDLKEKTVEELNQQLEETQKELFNLRLQQVAGQLENSSRIRDLRRTVARIKTLQNEKEA